jgi:very-short-patch-repair endonuclease
LGEIIEKLQDKIIKKLLPICQKMRDEGFSDADIQRFVRAHQGKKAFDFYKSNIVQMPTVFGTVIEGLSGYDSKIEAVLYKVFEQNNISFKFQYRIGPYRADYLIWGFLVVELDGPQHELQKEHDQRRDNYMEKMGYKILRTPTWVLVHQPEDVLEKILGFKPKEKVKKRNKKK